MKLYVGSGEKKKEGYESIDLYDFGHNFVWDMRKGYGPWEDKKITEVYAEHFLEHLTYEEVIKFLNDTWEILRPTNGVVHICVPSIYRDAAWTLAHRSFYVERTFKELETDEMKVYGMKNWKIDRIITNSKKDIYCWMRPVDGHVREKTKSVECVGKI